MAIAEAGDRAIIMVLISNATATLPETAMPVTKGMNEEKNKSTKNDEMNVAPMKPQRTQAIGLINFFSFPLFNSIPAARAMQEIEN
mmetsp:Transcript_33426/g.53889  ORF Transcript_33426/g.53889 Transcript_33426/m.53889 type:complete len:86 (-) Transcript_33426:673-930(-)